MARTTLSRAEQARQIVHRAIERDLMLAFLYQDRHGRITSRLIEPVRTEHDRIYGWCLHREDIRLFRFAGMLHPRFGPERHEILLPLPELEELPELAYLFHSQGPDDERNDDR